MRVILAALFGFALIAGAEPIRSRDDRVSQALAAAGVAALYGSLLSAVALHDMISKVAASGAAAALTAFAITLSLRHGILVAALAFVGGFLSPAIIGSEQPNTPVLFGYLLAIAAGTLIVIRMRGWWVLGWGVLAGSALWTVLWMLGDPDLPELHWVGLFHRGGRRLLFVWATLAAHAGERRIRQGRACAGLGVAGRHRRLPRSAHCPRIPGNRPRAGWPSQSIGDRHLRFSRDGPRFQFAAGLPPTLSLAALALWWWTSNGIPADWNRAASAGS